MSKKLPYGKKKIPITVGVTREKRDAFDKRLKELGLNRSVVIGEFINDFLKQTK